MTPLIREHALVEQLVSHLPRCAGQRNGLFESDAELVQVNEGTSLALAVTTDAIVEEIESGLYADPFLIGWMTVMANMSDLAAVGAEPLGLLIAETLPHDMLPSDRRALQEGIRDAALVVGTGVLGGDTNVGSHLHMTGTAIGIVRGGNAMSRVGCRVGDLVYATGPLGIGNAFAAATFMHTPGDPPRFRPRARIREGLFLRTFATSCMDTSDGLFATLDQLGRLNGIGFHLDQDWEGKIAPEARELALRAGLPPWMLLCGPHGEFELLFTVPSDVEQKMIESAASERLPLWHLGTVTEEPGVTLPRGGHFTPVALAAVQNREVRAASEVSSFLDFLRDIGECAQRSTER
jgi:thiamine-monophosphate kinase